MHDYQRILGERVKAERLKRKLTQTHLAALVHSNKRTIIDIEKGRGNPKLDTLYELLTFFNIDPYPIFYPAPNERSEAITEMEALLHECPESQIKLLVPVNKVIIEFAEASGRIKAT